MLNFLNSKERAIKRKLEITRQQGAADLKEAIRQNTLVLERLRQATEVAVARGKHTTVFTDSPTSVQVPILAQPPKEELEKKVTPPHRLAARTFDRQKIETAFRILVIGFVVALAIPTINYIATQIPIWNAENAETQEPDFENTQKIPFSPKEILRQQEITILIDSNYPTFELAYGRAVNAFDPDSSPNNKRQAKKLTAAVQQFNHETRNKKKFRRKKPQPGEYNFVLLTVEDKNGKPVSLAVLTEAPMLY